MKKASKILTLILIVVFVLSVFAGCDLVGRNVKLYRATVAMTVGDQEITIGKLLDTFNSYYNNYYYYVSAGYLTADSLIEMAVNSLVQQYIQVDAYVNDPNTKVQSPDLKGVVTNAEYLTQEQWEYCIKYVKYTSFKTFDSAVVTTLSVKYDIGDAESEDTSRNFTEYDDLTDVTNYADYYRDQNFVSEEADEYFDKYYSSGSVDFTKVGADLIADYVYTEDNDDINAILDELNARIEDNEDESNQITAEEYVEAQQKALDQYSDTIDNGYGVTLDEFMELQVADMVTSCILALWSYNQYKDVGATLTGENGLLQEVDETLAKEQAARFEINGDFDSFITGLSDSTFIYNVPQDLGSNYVFVKNILIPFSSVDSSFLSGNTFSGTDSEAYKDLRNSLAEQIVAEYFTSDDYDAGIEALFAEYFETKAEDDDSDNETIKNVFKLEDGKIVINSDGALGQFFASDGSVTPIEGKDATATIVELMKRFNTDTAQHSSRYDYVVYVGSDWKDYSHSWVKEFYTAVNELRTDENGDFDGVGKYAICVSTYGVHIIYVEGFVSSKLYTFDWTNNADAWKDSSSLSYVRYKAEFENKVSLATQDAFDKLEAEYLNKDNNLIQLTKYFKRFLKNNDFTFDFEEYREETLEELGVN